MNPDKLFDYLDGKLGEGEREQLERQLATDHQLQRQLAVARDIHRGMRGSREVIPPYECDAATTRAGVLGRRVAIAFVALVAANVLLGILFIIGKHEKRNDLPTREAAMRQQLVASLNQAAETQLPAPTVAPAPILIAAAPAERDGVAERIIALAQQFGGTAAKGPSDATGLNVLVTLPASREHEFRRALAPFGVADAATGTSVSSNPESTTLQIRIADRAQ